MTRQLLAHDLLLGDFAEMIELEPHLVRGDALSLGGEVGDQLVDDMAVATGEFGFDDGFRIGVGDVAGEAHLARGPQSGEPVAARGHLEAKLLIVLEPGLEILLAIVKGRHACLVCYPLPQYSRMTGSCARW